MKQRILQKLASSLGEYVSGEELSKLLGVSRTAVWKHMQVLKEEGYRLESQSRHGYRLLELPDVLYPWEILPGSLQYLGTCIIHRQQVDSTNALARELAENGAAEGTVVVAEEQTGGKGRLGRQWASPPGLGIWVSLILRPAITPSEAAKITMLASVGIVRALQSLTGLSAGIKWPNDVLVNNRKICGILTEMKAEIDAVSYVILGIGVNVNLDRRDFPAEARERATSVRLEIGRPVSRKELLRVILVELDNLYGEYLRQGFEVVRSLWLKYNVTLGREVQVTSLTGRYRGRAVALADDGALLVSCEDGQTRPFYAGDVTLRS